MADIELVIKISEEQYEMIQNISNFISADATQIIRNGILLPKGHGRMTNDGHKDMPEDPKRAYEEGYKSGYDKGYATGINAVINLLLRFLEEIKP